MWPWASLLLSWDFASFESTFFVFFDISLFRLKTDFYPRPQLGHIAHFLVAGRQPLRSSFSSLSAKKRLVAPIFSITKNLKFPPSSVRSLSGGRSLTLRNVFPFAVFPPGLNEYPLPLEGNTQFTLHTQRSREQAVGPGPSQRNPPRLTGNQGYSLVHHGAPDDGRPQT